MSDTEQHANPLLKRIQLPGETHALPSLGLFYAPEDGILDSSVKNGEIHFFPMKAYDEIVLRSHDMLFSGEAIKTVISRCAPQILKPEKLLATDVDFIMLVLRLVSYGDEYTVSYQHTCDNAKSHSYIISINSIIRKTRRIDPTLYNEVFSIKLPNDQVIKMTPIRYQGIIDMLQATEIKTVDEQRDMFIKILLDWIESVDGITDKEMIKEWLTQIPAGFAEIIENSIDNTKNHWGTDVTAALTCRDCGGKIEIASPINPLSFFM